MKLQKNPCIYSDTKKVCAREGNFYEECLIMHVDRIIELEKLPFFSSHQCNNAKIIELKIAGNRIFVQFLKVSFYHPIGYLLTENGKR